MDNSPNLTAATNASAKCHIQDTKRTNNLGNPPCWVSRDTPGVRFNKRAKCKAGCAGLRAGGRAAAWMTAGRSRLGCCRSAWLVLTDSQISEAGFEYIAGGIARKTGEQNDSPRDFVVGQALAEELEQGVFFESRSVIGRNEGDRLFAPARVWLAHDRFTPGN
jgi:hypothetical protein